MKHEELRAFGQFLRIARDSLGDKMSQADLENYLDFPGQTIATLVYKMETNKVARQYDIQIGSVLDNISAEAMKEEPTMEEQGVIWIAFYQYDTNQMTIQEAADYLDCSDKYVYKLVKDGRLKTAKIAGKTMVMRNSAEIIKEAK